MVLSARLEHADVALHEERDNQVRLVQWLRDVRTLTVEATSAGRGDEAHLHIDPAIAHLGQLVRGDPRSGIEVMEDGEDMLASCPKVPACDGQATDAREEAPQRKRPEGLGFDGRRPDPLHDFGEKERGDLALEAERQSARGGTRRPLMRARSLRSRGSAVPPRP